MAIKRFDLRLIVGSGLLAACGLTWAGESLSIDSYTIDAGGGYSFGGDFELEGTIGQPDAGGPMTGGDFELTGGFWPGVVETIILPGDCNGDGHVALDDYADFALCLLGPAGTVGEGCDCFDLNGDAHVDLRDAGMLLTVFTGN